MDGVAFTAGHCVNDPGVGWATNWAFVPGYRNGTAPFGVFAAKNLWASSAWIQAENRNYDLGAAVLATNGSGQTAEAAVGARGIAFNQDKHQHYTSWGYPAAPPFTGGLLYTCTSDWVMDDPYPTDVAPPMGITCEMTGGSSGGAWVIGDQYVNSVNSFGYGSYPGIMFGPYFGEVARSLYLAVCGCESEWDTTPPETTITSGPAGVTNDNTPTFGFSSSEAGSSFECRLDSGAFQGGCSSPKTLGPLADGLHSFEVRATDTASNIDPTPALRNFTVDTSPPDTAVSGSASAKGTQRQEGKKIVVKAKVKAGEDLYAVGTGRVKLRKKTYELEARPKSVAAGEQEALKLTPTRERDTEAIAKALKAGRKATAKLTVDLSDAAGNSETAKLSVTLKSDQG